MVNDKIIWSSKARYNILDPDAKESALEMVRLE